MIGTKEETNFVCLHTLMVFSNPDNRSICVKAQSPPIAEFAVVTSLKTHGERVTNLCVPITLTDLSTAQTPH